MKAIIKNKKQLDEANGAIFNGEGWHLKGQFFPIESLRFSGKIFEFKKMFKNCYGAIIEGAWHFFSEQALIFFNEENREMMFELWLDKYYPNKKCENENNDIDIATLREIFNAMDEEDIYSN